MKRIKLVAALGTLAGLSLGVTANAQDSRDYIAIVGSSTVYPFATVVAERFGNVTDFKSPKVESTGSGGGLKLFCSGIGFATPDVTNSSRRIKESEVQTCAENGVTEIIEVKIGYDGIVIANSKESKPMELTRKEIFLALAKEVPNPKGGDEMVANPYEKWSDINPDLPNVTIEVMGPPPTSGTRDAFVELAMEGGCKQFDVYKAMKKADEGAYKAACHTIREDGRFIEATENDNLIVQKLKANPRALGIFGYSFLEQNADVVQGALVDGHLPEFDLISSGDYPVSRPLYFYVKKAHIGTVPGIREFLTEFTSENAAGEEGYLTEKGLIPLPEDEFAEMVASVKALTPLNLNASN